MKCQRRGNKPPTGGHERCEHAQTSGAFQAARRKRNHDPSHASAMSARSATARSFYCLSGHLPGHTTACAALSETLPLLYLVVSGKSRNNATNQQLRHILALRTTQLSPTRENTGQSVAQRRKSAFNYAQSDVWGCSCGGPGSVSCVPISQFLPCDQGISLQAGSFGRPTRRPLRPLYRYSETSTPRR